MTIHHDPDEYLSVEVAGQVAGIPPRTLRRWVLAGRVSATEGPRGKLVRLGDVHALAETTGRPLAGQWPEGAPATDADQVAEMAGHDSAMAGHATATGAGVDLAPLVELVAGLHQENRQLAEAAAVWQVRAMQAEDRLKQLTAGPDLRDDGPTTAPEGAAVTNTPNSTQDNPAPWWARWWRRS